MRTREMEPRADKLEREEVRGSVGSEEGEGGLQLAVERRRLR